MFGKLKIVTSSVTTVLLIFLGYVGYGNSAMSSIRSTVSNIDFVSQLGGGATGWVNGTQKIKPNDIAERQMAAILAPKECNFNHDDWDDGSGQLDYDEKTGLYSMPLGVYSSTIRYDRSVSSDSTTRFTFTPTTSLINTVILFHDLFEIVVGDGDRYGTTFKASTGSEKMEQIGERIITVGGMKVGNDVTVTITQAPLPRGDFEVLLSIEYTKDNGQQNKVSTYRYFPIPAKFKGTNEPIRVSVGFSNIKNKEETSAFFKCFKVSKFQSTPKVATANKEQEDI